MFVFFTLFTTITSNEPTISTLFTTITSNEPTICYLNGRFNKSQLPLFMVAKLLRDVTLKSPNLCKKENLFYHSYLYDLKLGVNSFPGYDTHIRYVSKEFKEDAEKDKNIILGDFVHYSAQDDSKLNFIAPGKYFREEMLRSGTKMSMPDICDKFPPRNFLPPSVFSLSPVISEVQQIYDVFKKNPIMKKLITNVMDECTSPASTGESKKCVVTVDHMINFVTSVLGTNARVSKTENNNWSSSSVVFGVVERINSEVSISCHQLLVPSMMYVCHHVPNVRIYHAEIMDLKWKYVINNGVTICNLNTTA
ncbi:hypothetical protein RYX36_011671 [Vicia faba]